MGKDRTLVRASDISLWAYCHRAWWLAQVKGAPHENPQLLSRGADAHVAHGSRALRAQRIQRIGLWIFLIALLALTAALLIRWM